LSRYFPSKHKNNTKSMSAYDDDDEKEGPSSSFETYLSEGDALYKQSEYIKALESYTLALTVQPNEKTCLVARSKCHLKLGDPQKALQDAESALKDDNNYNKGLYRKAEALYSLGDFEYALMFYHRGHKLRPELDEFRLGIQKAEEAIENSIGACADIKLENKGDLSFFAKQEDVVYKKPTDPNARQKKPQATRKKKEVKKPPVSKKTAKKLLGELYADKEYFQKLMEDQEFVKRKAKNNHIYQLVKGGLEYFETRTEFWRQQKPLYARRVDRQRLNNARKKEDPRPPTSQSEIVLKKLKEIDDALTKGDVEKTLRIGLKLLKTVENSTEDELSNKVEVMATIHSCIGNAYLEMDVIPKSLKHHQIDLQLSRQGESWDGESRALDNVGRAHAKMGDFGAAIDCWMTKLPYLTNPLDTSWLCHEIGRSHLELGNHNEAKEFGQKSLASGVECKDLVWQLNASVLIGQSEMLLHEIQSAHDSFTHALTIAIELEDGNAQASISKALSDLKELSTRLSRLQEQVVEGNSSLEDDDHATDDSNAINAGAISDENDIDENNEKETGTENNEDSTGSDEIETPENNDDQNNDE